MFFKLGLVAFAVFIHTNCSHNPLFHTNGELVGVESRGKLRLPFGQIYLVAVGEHEDVFFPARDVQLALLVEVAEVTRREHSVAENRADQYDAKLGVQRLFRHQERRYRRHDGDDRRLEEVAVLVQVTEPARKGYARIERERDLARGRT